VDAGRCLLAAQVAAFLTRPPADQARHLLEAWAAQPLAPAELPSGLVLTDVDWSALLDWLFARLNELGPGAVLLRDLLAGWTTHWGPVLQPPILALPPGHPPPTPALSNQVLTALIRGPLARLGFVQGDGEWIAVSPDGWAWLRGAFTLTAATERPTLDGLRIRLPPLTAAALRFGLIPWTEPQAAGPDALVLAFTADSVRRGRDHIGSFGPLHDLLRRHELVPSEALMNLLRVCDDMPPLRLHAALLLQADAPETLDALLAQRTFRRYLGERLSPHTVLVRHEAPLRRTLARRGLLAPDPPAAPPAVSVESTYHLVLALRLAQAAAPAYASVFARLAAQHRAALSIAQRAELDEIWQALETPFPDEEPVPPGAEPISLLDRPALNALLAVAIAGGHTLRIRYYSATRGVVGWRPIRPLARHGAYLDAFCLHARDDRCFRLDRILEVAETDLTPPATPITPTVPPTPTEAPPPTPSVVLSPEYGETS
jgi:hypothetical protein